MFTGIVQAVGEVTAVSRKGGDAELTIESGALQLERVSVGDSVAVAGTCLTVTRIEGRRFSADASNETLRLTTLGSLGPGGRVNLESALRAGDALGGHYVTGHIDGRGRVVAIEDDGRSRRLALELPAALGRYVAARGSITVDGVSLTVNDILDGRFRVNVIPHTLAVTTLGALKAGDAVNLEVDIIARYLERLAATDAGR